MTLGRRLATVAVAAGVVALAGCGGDEAEAPQDVEQQLDEAGEEAQEQVDEAQEQVDEAQDAVEDPAGEAEEQLDRELDELQGEGGGEGE